MLDKEKLFQPTGQHGSTFMSPFFMTMWNHPRWSNSGSSSKDGTTQSRPSAFGLPFMDLLDGL
jgi:hypothetical protein